MEIQNNVSFGTKFRTVNILETTTLRCIESDSVADLKPVIDNLWPKKIKSTGWRGYRYFLSEIGKQITDKYPEIAEATENMKNFITHNPNAKKIDLQQHSKSIIKTLGDEIDITL